MTTRSIRRTLTASSILFLAATASAPKPALADENGVSVWLPGIYGSLAATPQQPGWSLASVYYHTSVEDAAAVAISREITVGRFRPSITASLDATLKANADIALFSPSYVFASPVLGGQAAVGMMGTVGHASASVDATLTVTAGQLEIARSYQVTDTATGIGDLFPQASLRWNRGVHNLMIYGMTGVPVGDYDAKRLANLGTGHWSMDGGAGYTYYNPQSGREFSMVSGLTYNFENPSTDYRNGIDWHMDWGFSQFLSKQMLVGAVGYAYQQLTADSGASPILGDFESRVLGIGPQIGFIFPVGDMQGYLNLKGYKEFDAENRPEGWNAWVTFAISPAPASHPKVSLK